MTDKEGSCHPSSQGYHPKNENGSPTIQTREELNLSQRNLNSDLFQLGSFILGGLARELQLGDSSLGALVHEFVHGKL